MVGDYEAFSQADERALVLLATGADPWLEEGANGYLLFVPVAQEGNALEQIAAYNREVAEGLAKPPPTPPTPVYSGAWTVSLALSILIICFAWQSTDPGITERGFNSTTAILEDGEWWRPFSALFLHADLAHLLGNLGGITLFGTLLIRSIGAWLAYPAILLSGGLGNLLNVAFHYPDLHRSLGASTSVFGALGALAACGFMELVHSRSRLPWRRIMIPLVGGLALLGWMGGGNPGSQTDVGAHLAGFLCGIGIGIFIKLTSSALPDQHHYMK